MDGFNFFNGPEYIKALTEIHVYVGDYWVSRYHFTSSYTDRILSKGIDDGLKQLCHGVVLERENTVYEIEDIVAAAFLVVQALLVYSASHTKCIEFVKSFFDLSDFEDVKTVLQWFWRC